MHIKIKRTLGLILLAALLLAALLQGLSPHVGPTVDITPRQRGALKESINRKNHEHSSSYGNIPYHTKESVARCAAQERFSLASCLFSSPFHLSDFSPWHRLLAYNTCACVADNESFRLPFSNFLSPRVWAHDVGVAFLESQPDPEETKAHRAEEYSQYQKRSHTQTHTHMHTNTNFTLTVSFQPVTGLLFELDMVMKVLSDIVFFCEGSTVLLMSWLWRRQTALFSFPPRASRCGLSKPS